MTLDSGLSWVPHVRRVKRVAGAVLRDMFASQRAVGGALQRRHMLGAWTVWARASVECCVDLAMVRWRSSVGLPLGFIIDQERSSVDRSSIMC